MADIFKLIGARLERGRDRKSDDDESSISRPEKQTANRIDIDDFIIGEEEKRHVDTKKRNYSIDDELFGEEEIGGKQEKKDYLSDIKKLDFIELNRMPEKRQNKELKKEYLSLLDKLEELSGEINKLSHNSGNSSIQIHQLKKESYVLRDLIRLIGNLLPDGTDLKAILDTSSWKIEDIEKPLLEKIQFAIDRAKNTDEYINEKTKQLQNEIKALKRKCMQLENEKSQLEYNLSQQNQIFQQQIQAIQQQQSMQTLPPTVDEIPKEDPEVLKQQQELEELKRMLEEKQRTLDEKKQTAPTSIQNPTTQTTPTYTPPPYIPPVSYTPPIPQPINDDEPDYTVEYGEDEQDEQDDLAYSGLSIIDLERHLDNLPDARKYMIEVIGNTGISRNQELKDFLEKDKKGCDFFKKGTKFSYADMSAATKGLKDSGYLNSEKVNLGSKGGYNFQVFELSETGKDLYRMISKKTPVVTEMKKILDQHKSLEHGYLIKDCATEFHEMGYKVFSDRQDLRFDLPDGKRKDFDLVIEDTNGKRMHLEVERGTHTDEDFFNLMDKIYQVMTKLAISPAEFYFVSPNEQALYSKTKRQFYKWINERMGGMAEVKGKIVVNFTTFDKIKKRAKAIWETIYL